MVKKFTVISVLLLYSLASFGIGLNFFYCCGKLKEVTVVVAPPHDTGCKKKGGKKCCQNKTLTHKISVDQKISPQIAFELLRFAQPAVVFNPMPAPAVYHEDIAFTDFYAKPPPCLSSNLNILLSTFRI